MLSLETCKSILGNNVNNEDIKVIRDYLYMLVSLQHEMKNNVIKTDKYECNNIL